MGGIRDRRQFLHEIAVLELLLDHGRRDHFRVAQEAAGRLLGADALGELTGTEVETLDRNSVLRFERLEDSREVGSAQGHVVDHDLAFLLGGLDDLVPRTVLGVRGAQQTHETGDSRRHP
ncbi:hypothetical protein ACVWXQ_007884 [Bradyrhizobium sp. S3.14.4]